MAWRSRWDSLILFTPAQYDGLPGMAFPAPHDTYPGKDDVADYPLSSGGAKARS
jgi:putative flavoprotein involved in K+ transport